jgi:glycosyltransferase involved in cell wall biosynthesis
MDVLFSQPLTLLTGRSLPEEFCLLGNERGLSASYGRRFPRRVSDYVLRSHLALRLLRRRGNYRAVVTGRYGEFFAALQGALPLGRTPHLLLDIEWPHRHSGFFRHHLGKLFHRCVARGAWKIQVFCEAEIDNYAAYYGIDRHKFVWIPYCTDVAAVPGGCAEDDYIFTGGWQHRDYRTLFAALEGLAMPVKIAAPAARIDAPVPDNAHLLGTVSREAYLQALARARLVVLSLDNRVLRFPGVITYVLAMRLGKCVIVNDPRGACSYIDSGTTGVLVRNRDPAALRDALTSLWEDEPRRQWLGAQARAYAAQNLSTARYLADLRRLTAQMVEDRRGAL